MNDIAIFEHYEFGRVRTLIEDGEVLFGATDVAKALGYSNPHDAVNRHCRGVVKREGVSVTTNQHGVSTEQKVEMSIQEFIANELPILLENHDIDDFCAICSYVPDREATKLVRETFPNVFCYYPS